MAGTFALLEAWRAALEAAGVRAITDSRAQYSSPAGYLILPRPTATVHATIGDAACRLMSGSIWAVCDGPEGTAAWKALDNLVSVALPVIGSHSAGENWAPDVYTLQAIGIDSPAVEIQYADVPVRLY